jgi:hypothetical protein
MNDELELLKLLEAKIREMFEFTGWDDDIDPDARLAVDDVSRTLDDIDAYRRVRDQLAERRHSQL